MTNKEFPISKSSSAVSIDPRPWMGQRLGSKIDPSYYGKVNKKKHVGKSDKSKSGLDRLWLWRLYFVGMKLLRAMNANKPKQMASITKMHDLRSRLACER